MMLVKRTRLADETRDRKISNIVLFINIFYIIMLISIYCNVAQYTTTRCLKIRTPGICLNNSYKSIPILMIFGVKNRHIVLFYSSVLFCD